MSQPTTSVPTTCPLVSSQPTTNLNETNIESIPMQEEHGATEQVTEYKKRIRKQRLPVWLEFEQKTVSDKTELHAVIVKKSFDPDSKQGTTHLQNHLNTCKRRTMNRVNQTILTSLKNNDKSSKVVNWKFDESESQKIISQMIAKHDCTFNMVEYDYFRKLIRSYHPTTKFYSRNTIWGDLPKMYNEMKVELQRELDSISSRVSLTTNLRTAEHQNKDYCCLNCHYIDDEWKLHKKVIAYVMVASPHTCEVLTEVIKSLALSRNTDNKLFSISDDNATSNDVMIRNLKLWLNGKKSLLLDGEMFHMRCSAHILNFIVQDGLRVTDDFLRKIRESANYINASQSRLEKFESALTQTRLVGKGVERDVSTRWNSTYLMLKSVRH